MEEIIWKSVLRAHFSSSDNLLILSKLQNSRERGLEQHLAGYSKYLFFRILTKMILL